MLLTIGFVELEEEGKGIPLFTRYGNIPIIFFTPYMVSIFPLKCELNKVAKKHMLSCQTLHSREAECSFRVHTVSTSRKGGEVLGPNEAFSMEKEVHQEWWPGTGGGLCKESLAGCSLRN